MISAFWLIPALMIGATFGVIFMAMMQINRSDDDD